MSDEFLECISTKYDIKFLSALKNGLSWLPWIGKDYPNSGTKVLLVGESHYASGSNFSNLEQMCAVDSTADYENFTREVIWESIIQKRWSSPTFDNINRILVGSNNFPGRQLWNKIAFYNFVQRPMKTCNERPTRHDYDSGWRNFMDVIKIIEPSVCIFIGVSATNFFDDAMSNLDVEHSNVVLDTFLNSCWAREATVTLNGKEIHIHSIRHAGHHFSWKSWKEYLEQKLPETMTFLGEGTELNDSEDCTTEESAPQYVREHTKDIPTHLSHKPIIACNYEMINLADAYDAKYISVGRAQYANQDVSVKVFRHTGGRWSRQSEEIPIQRLGYMFETLLAAMLHCQNQEGHDFQTELQEEIISPEDIDFLRDQLQSPYLRSNIFERLGRIKALIEQIDPEKI